MNKCILWSVFLSLSLSICISFCLYGQHTQGVAKEALCAQILGKYDKSQGLRSAAFAAYASSQHLLIFYIAFSAEINAISQ